MPRVATTMVSLVVLFSLVSATLVMLPTTPRPHVAKALGITGDTYPGSGNWNLDHATVYDGVNVTVYGNINFNSGGSLTIKNAVLTMDFASQWEKAVNVYYHFFKLDHATLKTSNSSAGQAWLLVAASEGANIFVSNSTVQHTKLWGYGSGDYYDNSTFDASYVYYDYAETSQNGLNVSYNAFENLTNAYAVTACPTNSTITGNYIDDSCTQIYEAGYYGWITLFGSSTSGHVNGHYGRILKNHINATSAYQAIYTNAAHDLEVRSNVIDLVERNWNQSVHTGVLNAGIYHRYDGTSNSEISYNIVKRVVPFIGGSSWSDPLLWTYTGYSVGIVCYPFTAYVAIEHNQLWLVGSGGNSFAEGIDYPAEHGEINYNNISWTGGLHTAAWNTAGIKVDNGFDELFAVQNANHACWNNITYNVVNTVYVSSNGITVGWAYAGETVRYATVAHNTIGTVIYASGGLGIYYSCIDSWITDNQITDVKRDSFGIGLDHGVTGLTVERNTITISATGGYDWPSVMALEYCGAIAMNYEGIATTGQNVLVAYNDIRIQNRTWIGGTYPYPEYSIYGCNSNTVANQPTFIIDESSVFSSNNSKFIVKADGTAHYWLNGAPVDSVPDGQFQDYQATVGSSATWLNVTVHNPVARNIPNGIGNVIMIIVALAIILTIAGFAMAARQRGVDRGGLVSLVVFLIIAVTVEAMLYFFIGS